MALTLVTATSPVNQLANGIISIRCEDYVGAARGTLTTTADGASVAGTVVAETQTIAVQTTFVTRGTLYGGVANTVVVPKADLTLDPDADSYHVFISMFDTDSNGYVKISGIVEGGHCVVLRGYLASEAAYVGDNSWGTSWGQSGSFKIKVADFGRLLLEDGEAVAAVELPL